MTRFRLLALGLALFAAPLAAQDDPAHDDDGFTIEHAPFQLNIALLCTFTLECFDSEPCSETAFTPRVEGKAGGMTPDTLVVGASLISDAGTVELLGAREGNLTSLFGGGLDARHLLTIGLEGSARYSVHYADGPMVISYLGVCE
ncbi:hypothetical protein KUH32_14440 [Thalassococcus sp. CAU 1522]|uniref:Uncharacterized protein n=1 Tax=Thalassococcus arenae TaxID=2851652 RepID=A0ABS6NBB0_9RHOB|nr:hypothetical protein [Thalassococcus arenae]MBV2360962.1 hypothetical protein [Thalassococcus arenae]